MIHEGLEQKLKLPNRADRHFKCWDDCQNDTSERCKLIRKLIGLKSVWKETPSFWKIMHNSAFTDLANKKDFMYQMSA